MKKIKMPRLPATARGLARRMRFLAEMEKLKLVERQNSVLDASRRENSAEHSWHLAVMALLLADYADDPRVDPLRVLKMLLLHDIVEIDAGDTFLYDPKGRRTQSKRETASAKHLFGLLPAREARDLRALWEEFEARKTPDALFAASLDGLQPLFNHYLSGGRWVRRHALDTRDVLDKKRYIGDASKVLWKYARQLIDLSEHAGIFTSPQAGSRPPKRH